MGRGVVDVSDCVMKEELMAEVMIQTLRNGPLLVKGLIQLANAQGQPISTTEPTIALCRCGHSGTKPFCDGSHKKANFQAE